jgi:hypothetical protein
MKFTGYIVCPSRLPPSAQRCDSGPSDSAGTASHSTTTSYSLRHSASSENVQAASAMVQVRRLIAIASWLTATGPPHGMGRHVIVVSAYDQMMVRKGDYIFSHFYDLALVSVKLGILAFYWRVFVHPVFRTVVLATASFVVAWGIGITVTLFLACRPLNAYWDAGVTGQCLTMVTFTYFTNISNLITDIWIFLMPVPMIWHLQLQTKKKLLLSFIFCIGLA